MKLLSSIKMKLSAYLFILQLATRSASLAHPSDVSLGVTFGTRLHQPNEFTKTCVYKLGEPPYSDFIDGSCRRADDRGYERWRYSIIDLNACLSNIDGVLKGVPR